MGDSGLPWSGLPALPHPPDRAGTCAWKLHGLAPHLHLCGSGCPPYPSGRAEGHFVRAGDGPPERPEPGTLASISRPIIEASVKALARRPSRHWI